MNQYIGCCNSTELTVTVEHNRRWNIQITEHSPTTTVTVTINTLKFIQRYHEISSSCNGQHMMRESAAMPTPGEAVQRDTLTDCPGA